MKKTLKSLYLILGIIYLIGVNIVSYTIEPYSLKEPLILKIVLTLVTIILTSIVYILIIKPQIIVKNKLAQETLVMLYLAIIVIPLISLYI